MGDCVILDGLLRQNDEIELSYRMIYHVTSKNEWTSQEMNPKFVPQDFEREGFIHCCTPVQLDGVLQRYFKGKFDLLVLHIDEAKLKAEIKYESGGGEETFPHVYGAIEKEAIIKILSL